MTEAGFGFDLGGEKFFDLKCVSAGLDTAAVVLVATVRALKSHGGVERAALGRPNAAAVEQGLPNLFKHVENVRAFGEGPVVSLNRFAEDTTEEIEVVRQACERLGVPFALSEGFTEDGAGDTELAEMVMHHAKRQSKPFAPLYDWNEPIKDKLEKIARTMYGAAAVVWEHQAEKDLAVVRTCCGEALPLCVAKTQYSLSDDPNRLGRPEGFEMTVNGVIAAAGAGYIVPILGNMQRMPGLPASPQAARMSLASGTNT